MKDNNKNNRYKIYFQEKIKIKNNKDFYISKNLFINKASNFKNFLFVVPVGYGSYKIKHIAMNILRDNGSKIILNYSNILYNLLKDNLVEKGYDINLLSGDYHNCFCNFDIPGILNKSDIFVYLYSFVKYDIEYDEFSKIFYFIYDYLEKYKDEVSIYGIYDFFCNYSVYENKILKNKNLCNQLDILKKTISTRFSLEQIIDIVFLNFSRKNIFKYLENTKNMKKIDLLSFFTEKKVLFVNTENCNNDVKDYLKMIFMKIIEFYNSFFMNKLSLLSNKDNSINFFIEYDYYFFDEKDINILAVKNSFLNNFIYINDLQEFYTFVVSKSSINLNLFDVIVFLKEFKEIELIKNCYKNNFFNNYKEDNSKFVLDMAKNSYIYNCPSFVILGKNIKGLKKDFYIDYFDDKI